MNSSTVRRRRQGISQLQKESSRRLSLIAPPDLLHDVAWHTFEHEFSRNTPDRRHSFGGGILPGLAAIPTPTPQTRAVSERVGISKSDAAALHDKWRENENRADVDKFSWITEEGSESDDSEKKTLVSDNEKHEATAAKKATHLWSTKVWVAGLFFGYLLATASMQNLNNLRPGCGQLITLLQYLATIGEKSRHARQYIWSPVLPMKWHVLFVVLMFLTVQLANLSLKSGFPFALFLVVKNTNLVFSLLLQLALGKAFTISQMVSVLVITAGILMCVLAQNQFDGNNAKTETIEMKDGTSLLEEEDTTFDTGIAVGAALASASTACMVLLGSIQEIVFSQYKGTDGQESGESLFFTHLLGLPLFCVGGGLSSMRDDSLALIMTPVVSVSMVLLNLLGTVAVKQSFISLLEEGQGMTATLSVTVARMTGVVISQVMSTVLGQQDDGGSSNFSFWLGAALVAVGSLSYATGGRLFRSLKKR